LRLVEVGAPGVGVAEVEEDLVLPGELLRPERLERRAGRVEVVEPEVGAPEEVGRVSLETLVLRSGEESLPLVHVRAALLERPHGARVARVLLEEREVRRVARVRREGGARESEDREGPEEGPHPLLLLVELGVEATSELGDAALLLGDHAAGLALVAREVALGRAADDVELLRLAVHAELLGADHLELGRGRQETVAVLVVVAAAAATAAARLPLLDLLLDDLDQLLEGLLDVLLDRLD